MAPDKSVPRPVASCWGPAYLMIDTAYSRMRRRTFLRGGGAAVVALAGCIGPRFRRETRLRLLPATPELLSSRFARSFDSYDLSERELLRELFTDGPETRHEWIEDRENPTFWNGEYVRASTYYRVTTTFLGEARVARHRLHVRNVTEGTETSDPVATVQFDDLPETDRAAFLETDPDGLSLSASTTMTFGPDELDRDASRFAAADGPIRVLYQRTSYRVEHDIDERVDRLRYRYDTNEVASSRREFAEYLDCRYAFEIDRPSLSPEARDILDEAIDDDGDSGIEGYSEEGDPSELLVEILELVATNESPDEVDGRSGRWLCRYDGTLYVAEISGGTGIVTTERPYHTPEETSSDTSPGRTTSTGSTGTTPSGEPTAGRTTGRPTSDR